MKSIEPDVARAWWNRVQGLDGTWKINTPAEVLQRCGWARSVAGVGPYLTFFSRAGIGREDADRALEQQQIHELPSARGCTYVVPACDYGLALAVGSKFGFAQEWRVASKLGVTERELDRLCVAVVDALQSNALDPDEIRISVGKAVRSLGDEGKRKGMNSTLPLALGKLQQEGIIRRIPTNGRLDQQRYKYSIWKVNPLHEHAMPLEDSMTELARRFFRWIGPASISQFAWFSGLGIKAAAQTIERLQLVSLPDDDEQLLYAEQLDDILSFQVPKTRQYSLISSLDSIHALRRDVQCLLHDADREFVIATEKGSSTIGTLTDLPSHVILDRGRIVGLWEFDIDQQEVVYGSWVKPDRSMLSAIEATQAYIVEQLGDARSFSLDSPKSRKPRIEFLRSMTYT